MEILEIFMQKYIFEKQNEYRSMYEMLEHWPGQAHISPVTQQRSYIWPSSADKKQSLFSKCSGEKGVHITYSNVILTEMLWK